MTKGDQKNGCGRSRICRSCAERSASAGRPAASRQRARNASTAVSSARRPATHLAARECRSNAIGRGGMELWHRRKRRGSMHSSLRRRSGACARCRPVRRGGGLADQQDDSQGPQMPHPAAEPRTAVVGIAGAWPSSKITSRPWRSVPHSRRRHGRRQKIVHGISRCSARYCCEPGLGDCGGGSTRRKTCDCCCGTNPSFASVTRLWMYEGNCSW